MSSHFDFVIIGGGTSGLVVASRLSEIQDFRVLVLEAGGDHNSDPRVTTPAMWASLFGTEADWGFKTVTQVWASFTSDAFCPNGQHATALEHLHSQTSIDISKARTEQSICGFPPGEGTGRLKCH